MIKAVFFDIDGTLYDSDLDYLNQDSVDAIIKMHEQGIILGLCTGRSRNELLSVPVSLLNLPFDIYITSGGGCAYRKSGDLLHHTYFSEEQARKVAKLKKAGDFDLDISFLDNHGAGLLWECGTQGKINFDWYKIAVPEVREPTWNKIAHFMLAFEEQYHHLAIPYLEGLSYFTSSANSIDVYPSHIHKANGIEQALSTFNITLEEVMAFGDSVNDIEMLEKVGIGVAMGNGSEEVKRIANYVTTTMQDGGIIKALKKFEVLA